jgi:hypothetical protein
MEDKIQEYESQIEDLNVLVTQFASAVVASTQRETIANN